MNAITLSLIITVLAMMPVIGPWPISTTLQRTIKSLPLAIGLFLVNIVVAYLVNPSLVGPLFGEAGLIVGGEWLILGIAFAIASKGRATHGITFFVIGLVLTLGISLFTSPFFTAGTYAAITGPVESRNWTADVQPKDPQQMRIVDTDTARYIARKAVAQAGSVGSQFSPDFSLLTLQRKNGRLIYAVPLDYNSFSVWTSTGGSPGWIEIDAQDPEVAPRFVRPKSGALTWMPAAYGGYNLERAARNAGFGYDIAATEFVIDEAGAPHWILVGTAPSHGYNLPVIKAVLDLDPVTGTTKTYTPETVPGFVDVILPKAIVTDRLNAHGQYAGGWWNTVWTKQDIEASDSITLVSGNDGQLLWVSGVSQPNRNSDALVAMVYTDARTGKNVRYATPGGATDEGLIAAVDHNADVRFRHLHASIPQTYNVDGVMTAMLPVTNDIGAYQGVAFVEVANPQDVAYGPSEQAALTAYKAILMRRGQQVSLDNATASVELSGAVERFAAAPLESRLIEFTLSGQDRIFVGSANDYPGLSLARPGDHVTVTILDTPASVAPIRSFANRDLTLRASPGQRAVDAEAVTRQNADIAQRQVRDLKGRLDTLSPAEIEALQKQISAKP